jgi:mannosyltransferase
MKRTHSNSWDVANVTIELVPVGVSRRPRYFRWLLTTLTWLLPTALTALAVSWQSSRPDLWRDEFATWSAATRSVSGIIALGRHIDGVIVPYYLLEHFWIGWFGDTALAMRMPSILATTATAAVVALLARRWWGPAAGLLGGLLFAVLPVVSRYAQEARGYALATLFAALSTLVLAGALDRSRWWRWTGYALCVALMGLSHLLSLLILPGHLVLVGGAVWRTGRRRALYWLVAAAAGTGAVLPLTAQGFGQRGQQLDWLFAATPNDLAQISGSIFDVPVIGGAVPALALFALGRGRPAGRLWVTVLLPVALLYAYDQLVAPIFLGRYLMFVVPLLCALAGAGLTALRAPFAVLVVIVVGLIGLPDQGQIRREHSPFDYRAAAEVIEENAAPGDGIVYAPRDGWQLVDTGLGYYLRGRGPRDVLLAQDETSTASLWATECADPAACLRGTYRVWVVAADNLNPVYRASSTNQLSYTEQTALSAFARLIVWRVEGFTITLFTRPPAV